MAKKIVCKLFDCNLRYNFAAMANLCICRRCKTKWQRYNDGTNLGTDQEIADRWIRARRRFNYCLCILLACVFTNCANNDNSELLKLDKQFYEANDKIQYYDSLFHVAKNNGKFTDMQMYNDSTRYYFKEALRINAECKHIVYAR